jgi:hypothetical protein
MVPFLKPSGYGISKNKKPTTMTKICSSSPSKEDNNHFMLCIIGVMKLAAPV